MVAQFTAKTTNSEKAVVAQFTAKTTNSEKAIYFLTLMPCSINRLKPHMLFSCKNFKRKKIFLLKKIVRLPSYGMLYHMRNAWLFPSISNSMGKCRKIHLVSSQVVFPQYYCFYFFQNLGIS